MPITFTKNNADDHKSSWITVFNSGINIEGLCTNLNQIQYLPIIIPVPLEILPFFDKLLAKIIIFFYSQFSNFNINRFRANRYKLKNQQLDGKLYQIPKDNTRRKSATKLLPRSTI